MRRDCDMPSSTSRHARLSWISRLATLVLAALPAIGVATAGAGEDFAASADAIVAEDAEVFGAGDEIIAEDGEITIVEPSAAADWSARAIRQ
ncbi:MAG: hypothetical protein AB7U73_23785, partial [Pirellulales bacterium]